MENGNGSKRFEDLFVSLCLDPGFVLVPKDRYEELIRAETERDVLECTITGKNKYSADTVMDAIRAARAKVFHALKPLAELEGEDNAE